MTPAERRAIILDRLACWARDLDRDGATPLVLVGVRHDDGHVGQSVVCTVDDDGMGLAVLVAFLRQAADRLDPNQPQEASR